MRGVVIKTYNGYYYVQLNENVIMCTVRGRLKKERFTLLVGDEVDFAITGDGKGVIEQILPRHTLLERPMVANIDQVIVTFAAANPDISTTLIDRFLILTEMSQLPTVLCINKIDLANTSFIDPLIERYRKIGYPVLPLSAHTGTGVDELRQLLHNKITVFSGPSGAGKSTILNTLVPGYKLQTGELSEKIGRGKHTTRFAQLLAIPAGGFVVDTPGFSFTEFTNLDRSEVSHYFREFSSHSAHCRFSTCLHLKEPQCAVKKAVQNSLIDPERYRSYTEVMTEIMEKKGF